MNTISLSIFFPAHNEEANIAETIQKTLALTERLSRLRRYLSHYEIIVVNDGSKDKTGEIAQSLAAANPSVRVIEHGVNRGYGAALQSGIQGAKEDYIFFTDADLQFDVEEIEKLLKHVDRYDVIIGYRAPRKDPLPRLFFAWGWNRLNRLLFGLKVRDIDCAFKLFRRDLVQNLNLSSTGAMISAEMLIKLKRQGVRIKEVPVTHLPRLHGTPTGAKPSVILRAFQEMVRLYRGELGLVTHKQALKFMAVGVVNTAVDMSAYILLTRSLLLLADSLVAAKFSSYLLGTVTSFFLNRYWTFGLRSQIHGSEVAKFYTIAGLALLINTSAMYALVSIVRVHDLLALVLATLVTFAFNFTLSKLWVFRAPKNAPHSSHVAV